MTLPDTRTLSPLVRWRGAELARTSQDIAGWPSVSCWNDRPCDYHRSRPTPVGLTSPLAAVTDYTAYACDRCGEWGAHLCRMCDRCGVILRRHQRVGAAWLYLAGRGLLADSVGLGKTAQAAMVLALCKESGELSTANRAVVVCKPAAVGQWAGELHRMIPSLHVIAASGTPSQRIAAYVTPWEVAVVSAPTLAPAQGETVRRGGDIEYLENFTIGTVIYDDVDAMRKRTNRGAYAVRRLSQNATRVIGAHGTPLQKRLKELYCMLEPVGGTVVFGTERQFTHRFVDEQKTFYQSRDRAGRQVTRTKMTQVGVKNEDELRRLLGPLVLRRRAGDVDDSSLPAIQSNVVWLDGSPEQRRRYAELKQGVLRRLAEGAETITHPQAVAHWIHGWQICSGLATLDGGRDDSVKLDWVMDQVTGDLAEDKVVVFVNFKPNVQALSNRLESEGVGHVLMWGNETGARERDSRLTRFREDPACRVLVGTTTIEQSLNLQVARHLICVDTIPNPARMTQLAGRVRRSGSRYETVYLHQLLLRGTQEEGVLAQLHAEQASADLVWDETGDLFATETPLQIMQMIAGRAA